MDILTFLLGGAFGLAVANIALLLESFSKSDWSMEHTADTVHEVGALALLLVLFNIYRNL